MKYLKEIIGIFFGCILAVLIVFGVLSPLFLLIAMIFLVKACSGWYIFLVFPDLLLFAIVIYFCGDKDDTMTYDV